MKYFFIAGCLGLLLSSSLCSLAFESPSWDEKTRFEFLRRMGTAPSGGADIGECLEIARQAEGNNPASWADAWTKAARKQSQLAEKALEEGLLESAKERFLRSSNYFLAAEFLLPPNAQEKLTFAEEARTAFIKACRLSPDGFQPIHIPYEDTTLPGYFYLAPSHKPTKTIILNTGYDGTAEELS